MNLLNIFKKQEKVVDIPKKTFTIRNRCKCKVCGAILESKFRHHFVECNCNDGDNRIFTDGGYDYTRRGGCFDNIISLDEWGEEIDEDNFIWYKQMEETLFKTYMKKRKLTEEEIQNRKDKELERKTQLLLAVYEEDRKNRAMGLMTISL